MARAMGLHQLGMHTMGERSALLRPPVSSVELGVRIYIWAMVYLVSDNAGLRFWS